MDIKTVTSKLAENGLLVSSHGFEDLVENGIDVDGMIKIAKERNVWLITDEFIMEFIKAKETLEPKVEVVKTKHILAKDIEPELVIYEQSDVSDKSSCEGTVDDFVKHFNQRYSKIARILRERVNLRSAEQIKDVKKNEDATIIGIVTDKRKSEKGYRFLEVEDPTGSITVMVPLDKPALLRQYETILLDEVIGVSGKMYNELLVASEISEPDLPLDHIRNMADVPVCVAFISDLHIGSYLFLEKEFNNFLDWLNLKGNRRDVSERVKYLFVAGDLVDGVGIYPKQEEELSIPDIHKQYDFLAGLLERVPDYIEIVMCMGNHDAVRRAEPQPKLDRDIGGRLYELSNVHIVGNPVMVSTHGVKTLMYHGTSLDTMIGNLAECTYATPERAMIEYLKKRHLCPVYGEDGIMPEDRDYMVIDKIPDILHCGHVHTNGYATYRGVSVVNSGTWQGKTKYQEQLGHQPTPARLPVMNLQNHEVSMLYF